MYSISDYGDMIADSIRTESYAQALRQVIQPDSVVLDIGSGTGILSLLACQMGARRVYAIEPDDSIQVARQLASANGFAERITFVQDFSTRVDLPERVDVVVSDLNGVLPLYQLHIPSIIDVRQRLLAPQGVLIPQSETIWVAVVQCPDRYHKRIRGWSENPYALNLLEGQQIVTNNWVGARFKPAEILIKPQKWTVIDFRTVTTGNFENTLTWQAERTGTAHGLAVWFDEQMTDQIGFSNAPSAPKAIYGQAFFPFSQPIVLQRHETISVTLRADLVFEDYVWSWETQVHDSKNPKRAKLHLKQSTFLGMPLSVANLGKRAADHIPTLTEQGLVDHRILELMASHHALGEIAQRLVAEFPKQFSDPQQALSKVGELSLKYSR